MYSHLMKYFVALFLLYSLAAEAYDTKSKPNVVIIICDDLNDAIEGMGGHHQAITPNIDKLMQRGVRFTNAQTNAPICGPSRASLWTGLSPVTTGYYGYKQQRNHWRNNHIMKDAVTLFEHLVANDYTVYATGKIHHNGHEDWSIFNNKDGQSGFEVGPSFGPYPWDGDPQKNTVNIRGVLHPDMPQSMAGNGCWESFGPVKDLSETMNGKGTWLYQHSGAEYHYKSETDRDLMPDENCVMYAQKVLDQKHSSPFFMTVGFNRPHTPCYVPQKYFDMFPIETVERAAFLENDLDDCAKIITKNQDFNASGFHKYARYEEHGGDELLLKWTQAYLACVAFVDEQIGAVVEAIENSEYADNTLIILTSDHGYHMAEKEYIFKSSLWEESCRIPFVIAGLDAEKGVNCTAPISLLDVYPTVLDYCSIDNQPNKDTNNQSLDGHSLRPLIKAPQKGKWDGKPYAITVVASAKDLATDEPGQPEDQHYSIRTECFRYILCRNGEEELYDHSKDPYEWYNVANDPQYAQEKATLKEYINEVKRNK